jgi:hypothetical protein
MHPKKVIFVLGTFAVAGAVFGGRFLGGEARVPELREGHGVPPLMRQHNYERVWSKRKITRVLTIGGEKNPILENAVKVAADGQGNFYILDFGAHNVKKFSPRGEMIRSFGNGKGQGPGEFLFPADLLIDNAGKVWITDPMNGRIDVFTPDGRLAESIKPSRSVYRLTSGRRDELLLMHTPTGGALFSLLNTTQSQELMELPIGNLLVRQDHAQAAIALDGSIATGSDGGFVYAPLRFGVLLAFDASGRVRFFRETLDREPLPKVVVADDGTTFADREAPVAALSLSVVGEEIFVLNVFETGFKRKKIFDVYGYVDGKYHYSFEIPASFETGSVLKGGVVTLDGVSLALWALK